MLRFYRRLRKDESGATAVEYGLIAALISVTIITSVMAVESAMESAYNYISSSLTNALN